MCTRIIIQIFSASCTSRGTLAVPMGGCMASHLKAKPVFIHRLSLQNDIPTVVFGNKPNSSMFSPHLVITLTMQAICDKHGIDVDTCLI